MAIPSSTTSQHEESPADSQVPSGGTEQTAAGGGGAPDPTRLADLQRIFIGLLDVQCSIAGGQGGAVFLGVSKDAMGGLAAQYAVANTGPATGDLLSPATLAKMERVAHASCMMLATGRGTTQTPGAADWVSVQRAGALYGDEQRYRAIGTPLMADGKIEGACVILVKERGGIGAASEGGPGAMAGVGGGAKGVMVGSRGGDEWIIKAMIAVNAGFEAYLWRQQCLTVTEQKLMLREALELLDAAQQGSDANSMGAIIAHELKRRFNCTRVAIGLVRGDFIRLAALSGADEIDRNAPAVEAIEAAMEECASQDAEVIYPAPVGTENEPGLRRVTLAHERLSRSFGPSSCLSLPLRVEGDLVGVALLERGAQDPFPFAAVSLLRLVSQTVGPALWTRRLADRSLWEVAVDSTQRFTRELLGPRHTGIKLVAGLALIAILASAIVPVPGRITASGEVRAAAARTISPPYIGYLSQVYVRPGEEVSQGQALAEMDTSDLQLQLAQSHSELAAYQTQHDEALNRNDMAKAAQFDAEVRKSRATIALLNDNVGRSVLRSPVDGVVGRGDLEQFVRARVEPSQPLFEIITSRNLTVAYVDERDVQKVSIGQTGWFASKALPGEKLPVKVERITPVAEPYEGTNAYVVELSLDEVAVAQANGTTDPQVAKQGDVKPGGVNGALEAMRPGMRGVVKLEHGWTTVLAKFARPLVDEARLRLWW